MPIAGGVARARDIGEVPGRAGASEALAGLGWEPPRDLSLGMPPWQDGGDGIPPGGRG